MAPLYSIVTVIGLVLIFLSGRGRSRSSLARRSQNWRIEQIERKVDALLQQAGLEIETNYLTLVEVPAAKKMAILKVLRELTGLGLKETKRLIESVPVSLEYLVIDAVFAKQKLEEAGAIVVLKKLS